MLHSLRIALSPSTSLLRLRSAAVFACRQRQYSLVAAPSATATPAAQSLASNKSPPSRRPHRDGNGTKLPVVLCHGLFGFDTIGPDSIPRLQLSYWGGVADILRSTGSEVYVARVPATGNIEERAHHLDRYLRQNLRGRDVNLLAHSMGGLDSRFLVTHELGGGEYSVRSLTTVATPHRGSPIMDWIRDTIGLGADKLDDQTGRRQHLHQQQHQQQSYSPYALIKSAIASLMSRLDAPAYSNLTTEYLTQQFNPSTPDSPRVQYYSFGAAIDDVSPLSPLRLPWDIVHRREGANDGVVSAYSARWGTYVKTVHADHFDVRHGNIATTAAVAASAQPSASAAATESRSVAKSAAAPTSAPSSSMWSSLSSWSMPLPLLHVIAGIQALRLPHLSLGSITSLGMDSSATSSSAADSAHSITSYRDRIERSLDRLYGPASLDDFIYGYDDVEHGNDAYEKFDAVSFYRGIVGMLRRDGL